MTVKYYTQECGPSFVLMNFCNFTGEKFGRQLLHKSTHTHGRTFGELNELDRDLAVIASPHILTQLLDWNTAEESLIQKL